MNILSKYKPHKNVKKLTLTAVNKFLDYYTNGSYDQNTAIKIWQDIKDDEYIQEDLMLAVDEDLAKKGAYDRTY